MAAAVGGLRTELEICLMTEEDEEWSGETVDEAIVRQAYLAEILQWRIIHGEIIAPESATIPGFDRILTRRSLESATLLGMITQYVATLPGHQKKLFQEAFFSQIDGLPVAEAVLMPLGVQLSRMELQALLRDGADIETSEILDEVRKEGGPAGEHLLRCMWYVLSLQ